MIIIVTICVDEIQRIKMILVHLIIYSNLFLHSSVHLQYQWNILLPSVSSNEEESIKVEDSVFTIEPRCGYLSGNAAKKFKVLFEPHKVRFN